MQCQLAKNNLRISEVKVITFGKFKVDQRTTQQTNTYSKSLRETLEKGVKDAHVNFQQINVCLVYRDMQ